MRSSRITVPEIARRLGIGRLSVYRLLERGIVPAVRLGKRWIITRYAYERWEKTCGVRDQARDSMGACRSTGSVTIPGG